MVQQLSLPVTRASLICRVAVNSSVLTIAGFSSLDKTNFVLLSVSFCFFTIFILSARFGALSFSKLTNSFLFVVFSAMNLLFFVANYFTGEGINFYVLIHLNPDSLQAGLYTIEKYVFP